MIRAVLVATTGWLLFGLFLWLYWRTRGRERAWCEVWNAEAARRRTDHASSVVATQRPYRDVICDVCGVAHPAHPLPPPAPAPDVPVFQTGYSDSCPFCRAGSPYVNTFGGVLKKSAPRACADSSCVETFGPHVHCVCTHCEGRWVSLAKSTSGAESTATPKVERKGDF